MEKLYLQFIFHPWMKDETIFHPWMNKDEGVVRALKRTRVRLEKVEKWWALWALYFFLSKILPKTWHFHVDASFMHVTEGLYFQPNYTILQCGE
jgi:hypothetical protein